MGQITKRIQDLLPTGAKRGLQALRYYASDRKALKAARSVPLPEGVARVYHHHIRRTGGTSLNAAFYATGGADFADKEPLLASQGWMVHGGRVFVAHNKFLIDRGAYFFARSHSPAHELRLPPRTFTVTILRDPVERVISHYNVLAEWERSDVSHPSRATEGPWLGASFSEFLTRIPREHLLRQLYTFSAGFSVDEAHAALSRLDAVLMTEDYAAGLGALSARLGLDLAMFREKASVAGAPIGAGDLARLRELLEPEYALIARVKKGGNVYSRPAAATGAGRAPATE
ncbi:MAG: sulfotransferase family 2 domain-containing protein [Rhodospirillales bacterium]|nr:sulfotransferase family 2 domain-containing protein [Rhodospirillales bacterium]